jgi:hypothetical protein
MRRLEDAATHLLRNIDEMPIEYVLGDKEDLRNMRSQKPMRIFSDRTIEFLSEVSAYLKEKNRTLLNGDIAAFYFWFRKSHLKTLQSNYDNGYHIGRGVSLHFAPGNIPTQFAYTAAMGLLAGNCVILRLSSRETFEGKMIIDAFKHVIEKDFPDFKGRIVFIRYPHDKKVTDMLSMLCDVRVMWGADESINIIRQSIIKAGAVELPFFTRDSAAVFNAAQILKTDDLSPLCRNFYNDTYLNDQNACSSPHIIFWLGNEKEVSLAKEKFWKAFENVLDERNWEIQAETAVKKLTSAYVAATYIPHLKIIKNDNRIVRLEIPKEFESMEKLWEFSEPGGYFMEIQGERLEDMIPALGRICQTVSVFGIDTADVRKMAFENRVEGVDRVVEVGHTLDFDVIWDGFDLIQSMSRKI